MMDGFADCLREFTEATDKQLNRYRARISNRDATIRRLLEENRQLRGDLIAVTSSFKSVQKMERQIASESACRCSRCHPELSVDEHYQD